MKKNLNKKKLPKSSFRSSWFLTGIYIISLAIIFSNIDKYSRSATDTLIGVFIPFLLLTIILIVSWYKSIIKNISIHQ